MDISREVPNHNRAGVGAGPDHHLGGRGAVPQGMNERGQIWIGGHPSHRGVITGQDGPSTDLSTSGVIIVGSPGQVQQVAAGSATTGPGMKLIGSDGAGGEGLDGDHAGTGRVGGIQGESTGPGGAKMNPQGGGTSGVQ